MKSKFCVRIPNSVRYEINEFGNEESNKREKEREENQRRFVTFGSTERLYFSTSIKFIRVNPKNCHISTIWERKAMFVDRAGKKINGPGWGGGRNQRPWSCIHPCFLTGPQYSRCPTVGSALFF